MAREAYRPFRNVRILDDLVLVNREVRRTPVTVRAPKAHYAEICAWVTVSCDEAHLFGADQTLLAGSAPGTDGWRLSLTEYGYLRFEGGAGEEVVVFESAVPVHAAVDARRPFRLGFALTNYAWLLRDTSYVAEAGPYGRIRLLASAAGAGPWSEIGEWSTAFSPDLAPVPERMVAGADLKRERRFAGRIVRVEAYNTARVELFGRSRLRSAGRALPVVPGGGAFEPRWIGDDTVEVFTRPEFTQTSSYWVLLKVADASGKLRRLRVHTMWRGGVNMTPTFFWSRDRKRWRRVVPDRMWMGGNGTEFRVEFRLTKAMRQGGYLASAPAFLDDERAQLLDWARKQPHTTVAEMGRSVEDRPLHVIRVGKGDDRPGRRGVAVICGQHSPLEMMGGRVIEPMIRTLLRQPALVDTCSFYFVPTVNVDCAHYGGNGLNANQRNNNRHWFEDIQPENAAVIDYFDALKAAGQSIDFALDIHAGGIFKNHVLMHMGPSDDFTPTDEALAEQEVWRALLEQHAGLRRQDGWALPQQMLRASDYFHQVHGATAFCLELSTCSYFDPAGGQTRAFSGDALESLGSGLVAAVAGRD